MAAQVTTTAPRSTAARLMRAWIVAGLGALILLVIFMLHTTTPASASVTAAARPCATSATQCHKCTNCQKCTKCDAGVRCPCA